jgi:hypothetical protein
LVSANLCLVGLPHMRKAGIPYSAPLLLLLLLLLLLWVEQES